MEFSKLTEITIDYLINKKIYDKYLKSKNNIVKNNCRENIHFYKKRINHVTRNLMENKKEIYPKHISDLFDNYIKEVIDYFKILDENDSIQEDYIGLQLLEEIDELKKEDIIEDVNNDILENNIIIKSFSLPKSNQVSNLDNFVKIKKTQEEKIIQFPIQKEINLSDSQYKTKGIKYS